MRSFFFILTFIFTPAASQDESSDIQKMIVEYEELKKSSVSIPYEELLSEAERLKKENLQLKAEIQKLKLTCKN